MYQNDHDPSLDIARGQINKGAVVIVSGSVGMIVVNKASVRVRVRVRVKVRMIIDDDEKREVLLRTPKVSPVQRLHKTRMCVYFRKRIYRQTCRLNSFFSASTLCKPHHRHA